MLPNGCREASHDESGHPRSKTSHDAWTKDIAAIYRKAEKCMDQVKKDEQEAAKKPKKGCPGPDDDRNTHFSALR